MAAKKLNLDNFLPYRLSIASNALSERIAAEYQNRFGLKIPEWRLMAVLGEGKPKTQRELVAATRMDKETVNRAAKALADTGDPGFGAAYRRLRAGAGDTLGRYLAGAAAVSGVDHEWGTALGRTKADDPAPAGAGRENG